MPVFSLTSTTHFNFPATHELNLGSVFYVMPQGLSDALKDCDALLAVGARLFPVTYPEPNPTNILPNGTKLVQIDADAYELSKNVPADVALLANPNAALTELAEILRSRQTFVQKQAALQRTIETKAKVQQKREQYNRQAQVKWNNTPISVPRLINELREVLPANATVYPESVSNEQHVEAGIRADEALRMRRTGGQGLGACLPGCIGLQLARPDRKIVGICGDGAAMYSIQALWSAAHHNVPVTYIILNNRAYHVLKTTMIGFYGADKMRGRKFVEMNLTPPDLRFDRIAESMGVRGFRVETPNDLAKVLREALALGAPSLVDVAIEAPFD